MKWINRNLIAAVSLVATMLALCSRQGWAASHPVVLTESRQIKVYCVPVPEGFSCGEYSTGKFRVKAVFHTNEFGAIDPSQFDGNTALELSVGNVFIQRVLADDPQYVAGATKVTFLLTHPECDTNGENCVEISHGQLTLSISTKNGLSILISTKSGFDAIGHAFEASVVAYYFDGQPTGPVTAETAISGHLGEFSFDTNTSGLEVAVTGTVKTKGVVAKDGGTFDVTTTKIKGRRQPVSP